MSTAVRLIESTLLVLCILVSKSVSQAIQTSKNSFSNHTGQSNDISSHMTSGRPNLNIGVTNSYLTNVFRCKEEGLAPRLEKGLSTELSIRCQKGQVDDFAPTVAGITGRRLTKPFYEYYRKIIMAIKLCLHSVSVVMCSLAIVSFSRARIRSSSKSFIVAINLFELVSSLVSIGSFTLNNSLGTLHQVSAMFLLYAVMFINVACRRVVYMLNMLMCTQRMIVVVLPFKARTSFNHNVNQFIIVPVAMVVFCTHSYIPLAQRVLQIGNGQFVISNSKLYESNIGLFQGVRDTLIMIFSFIPLLVALLANFYLVCSLRTHFKKAQDLRATQVNTIDKESKITYMVMCSTLAFTLLSLPSNMNHLLETFLPNYGSKTQDKYLFSITRDGFYAFLVLGDITNFVSYFLLSSAFREYLIASLSSILVAMTVCQKRIKNNHLITSPVKDGATASEAITTSKSENT